MKVSSGVGLSFPSWYAHAAFSMLAGNLVALCHYRTHPAEVITRKAYHSSLVTPLAAVRAPDGRPAHPTRSLAFRWRRLNRILRAVAILGWFPLCPTT